VSTRVAALVVLSVSWAYAAAAQQRDTTARPPQPTDSLKVYTLPPAVVSVTRANPPINRIPQAVQLVEKAAISRARPTWGLDEALVSVPGVYAANRYNFSLDQRISIRGFGARSAFAVRGVKVIVDGIPQTLPDGQSQLTNLELGAADRIEILRGSSSALFGNASGGVISIWTDPTPPQSVRQDVRVLFGSFDRDLARNWSKWQSSTALRVGPGSALVTVSRLDYTGERDHSAADFRDLNTRWHFPLAPGWSLAATADVGWDPRADNPGGLNPVELASNPDAAAPLNLSRNAGKDVTQGQAGVTLERSFPDGGEAFLTVFGFTRGLTNPTTQAYIHLDRVDYGARAGMTRPLPIGTLEHRLTAGIDFQRQRDDRLNYGYFTAAPSQPDTTARLLDQLEHVTEVGPYVQSALQITPHLAVTAGLRYDWVKFQVGDRLVTPTNGDDSGDRLMKALSGTLGLAVTPSSAFTAYATIGTSFETPTTTELTNRPNGAGGFNPTLQPQRARNYEVGARGDIVGRLNYSVALFDAEVRDELISFPVPGDTTGRVFFRNAGRARHRGIELGTDLRVGAGVDLITAWTYSDFRYVDYAVGTRVLDGQALPGIPQHWLHLFLKAQPAFARGAWVELEERHSSGFAVDDTMSTSRAPHTSPWWTTNVRLGWSGRVAGVRCNPFVGFDNLFNRAYVGSVVINAANRRYYEPAPGRNMYVGFALGAGE